MSQSEVKQVLDVTLNGSRNYVQGSQILCQTAKSLCCCGVRVLRQATFSKITNYLVEMQVVEQKASLPEEVIGTAVFSTTAEEDIRVAWCETNQPAPRADLPMRCRWDAWRGGHPNPLDGQFRISEIHDFCDFLDVVVQTIKERHAALASDVRDIWFTGLRRATFQTQDLPVSEGVLAIRCDRIVGRDSAYQSLQRVSFAGENDVALEAFVTFSFKSEEFENIY